jgi:hypothetical protein
MQGMSQLKVIGYTAGTVQQITRHGLRQTFLPPSSSVDSRYPTIKLANSASFRLSGGVRDVS